MGGCHHCLSIAPPSFGNVLDSPKCREKRPQEKGKMKLAASWLVLTLPPALSPTACNMIHKTWDIRITIHKELEFWLWNPEKNEKRSSLLLASKVILPAFQSNHSRSCQMLSAKGNHIAISWFHPPNASTVIESFPPFHGFVQPASLK